MVPSGSYKLVLIKRHHNSICFKKVYMYIERICCNNHKILGNFTLPLVSKSNIPAFKDCVENVTIDTSDDTKNR